MTQVSSLTALTGAGVDTAVDLLPIVDMSLAGTARNKKITVDELILAIDVPERARDALGTALTAGSNITITPSDGGNTITIDASSGGAVEILDEGVSETAAVVSLNFVGSGVLANDTGGGAVEVTIPGGISTFVLGDATDVDTTGAAVGHALMHNGTEWISAGGTSFPGSPATGERFYRTDLNIEYFCFSTGPSVWLSTQLFRAEVQIQDALQSLSATTTIRSTNPEAGLHAIYVERVVVGYFPSSGATATNYFTMQMAYADGAGSTNLGGTISTQNATLSQFAHGAVTPNVTVPSTADVFQLTCTETLTSVTWVSGGVIHYRLVG